MIIIPGYTDSDKVPGAVAINQFGAGRISIGAIPLVCVLFGNMLSSGTATVNVPVDITTPEEAATYFGARSELARMAYAALDVTGVTLRCVAVTEASGAQATGIFAVEGSWSTAGEVTLQLDEEVFRVSFATSDNTLALAAAAIEAKVDGLQDGYMFCDSASASAAAANSAVTQTGSGPAVTLTGTPLITGDYIIEITLGGAVATATFKWSSDGGLSYTTGVTTAATVVLGATGVTANFAAGTYVLATTYTWQSNIAQHRTTCTVANVGIRGNQHTIFIVDQSKRPAGMKLWIYGGTALSNGGKPFSGGSGTDDLTSALAAVAAVQNDYEAFAQNDATNMGLVETATNNKAAYDIGLLQQYVTSTNGSVSGAIAIGQAQMNDVLGVCAWVQRGVEHPSRVTTRVAALFSVTDGNQPNTNYDDMVLPGAAPQYVEADRPSRSVKNAALNASIMPLTTKDGKLQIVRAINSHSLNGSTPDFRTYDHSETTVPIRIRKELLALADELKQGNPYSGPDVSDEEGLPPEGTLTPRLWTSRVTAELKIWEGAEFNWLTEVDDNLPTAEWNRTSKRIMSVVPTVVKPQFHQLGVIVRQQAA